MRPGKSNHWYRLRSFDMLVNPQSTSAVRQKASLDRPSSLYPSRRRNCTKVAGALAAQR